MIKEDSMTFNGNIITVTREMIDTVLNDNTTFFSSLRKYTQYDILYSDTMVGAEWDFAVYDKNQNNKRIGKIDDWNGGCELCTLYTKDLLTIVNKNSIEEMLDTYYDLIAEAIPRNELNANKASSQIFEITNFKGTVTNTYKTNEEEDCDELILEYKGIDTNTNKTIDIYLT